MSDQMKVVDGAYWSFIVLYLAMFIMELYLWAGYTELFDLPLS